jgi:hypothetical protein
VSRTVFLAGLCALGALSLLALLVSGGSPAAAAAPVLGLALLWAAWRAPLKATLVAFMFLSLIAVALQDNPHEVYWQSPLQGLGALLSDNWSRTFGVPLLSFSGSDLLAALLLLRIAMRGGAGGTAFVLWRALGAFLAGLVALAVWGAVQGGQLGIAYWQVRQLVYIPVFAFLLAQALEGESDLRLLGPIVIAAALVKAALGLYFYLAIARPEGLQISFVTSHADSVLFCISIVLMLLRWLEQPDAKSLRRFLWIAPILLAAIWLNNRRIAWVELAVGLALVWQLSRWNAAKRAAARTALVCGPLLALYLAVGWYSSAAFFKPVVSIKTIVGPSASARDSSSQSRRIENFNLSQTLRAHPLGIGLGQPYEEFVKGPDISDGFALYRYIPHNSVLWMMAAGGPIGFFLLWAPFAVGMFLAVRARRLARSPIERIAAIAAVCTVVVYLIQAYGDMGTQNWATTWLVAAALAVAGKVAVATETVKEDVCTALA